MPDFIKKENGNIDWQRFFMAISVAVVFAVQGISQIQHNQTRTEINDIHKTYTPSVEIKADMEVNKENLKSVLQDINRRLKALEYETVPLPKTNNV